MRSGNDWMVWLRNDEHCDAPEGTGRSLAELEREIRELGAHIAAATCRWLLLIAEFDERGGWAEWGIVSCAHWLSWRCSLGLSTAREHVRVARRLKELPLVREAFGRGQLSYCKVRAITRIAEPQTEAQYVELARHATGAQLEKVARGCVSAIRATKERAERAHEDRYLSWSFDDDGSLRLEGRLPAEDGALLLCALEAVAEAPLYGSAPEDASAEAPPTTPYQRRADALVMLARAGLATAGTRRSGGDPCELVLHIDEATLGGEAVKDRSDLRAPGTPAEPLVLAPQTARRLGCDASVVPVITRAGEPLSVGRRRRTVPPAIRRALRARDHGCHFPGCTHTRFLHAHHIRHWAHGGATRLDNLIELCSHHHRLVHEGGYTVERAGRRGVRFRRPDGREIPSAPPITPPRGPSLECRNRDAGLDIDAASCTPLSAGARLDYDIAVRCLLANRDRGP